MFGDEFRFGSNYGPWRELSRLRDEVNRLFSGSLEGRPTATPAINVWTNDDGAVMRVLLPGFDAKDIDVSVLGDSVTISGKRDAPKHKDEATCHRRERDFGSFARTLQLPFRLESQQVKAEFKNGVLELKLPRADADRPKRIAVSV